MFVPIQNLNIEETTTIEQEFTDFDLMISNTAVKLVNEGKAKWVYISEGLNNIAVIFAVTDNYIDEKYQNGLQFIQNKVFRVLKCRERHYSLFTSAKQQLEYVNMFYDYVVKDSKIRDPELFKYVVQYHELTLTNELLKSISDGIEEARVIHLENDS